MCEGVAGGEYVEVPVIDRGDGEPDIVKIDRCIASWVLQLNLHHVRTYSSSCRDQAILIAAEDTEKAVRAGFDLEMTPSGPERVCVWLPGVPVLPERSFPMRG